MEGGGSNWFLIGEGGELGEGWGGEEREAGAIERGDGDGFGLIRAGECWEVVSEGR